MSDAYALDPLRTRDIGPEVLDEHGRLRILPAAYWATTTPAERGLFGHRHALYGFPTIELVDRLCEIIGDREAIEIGAGSGVLAEALGIIGTDSHQQEMPKYRALFSSSGQPTIRYGKNVINVDAISAVRRYRPEVVVGCWVTHKYHPRRHWAGGNEAGIDEDELLAGCQDYILIGNERVHQHKTIWARQHAIEYPSFVYSRAMNGSRDCIGVWPGMWDLPEHLAMPVDEQGDGPAEPEDTVRIVCWCGREGCTEF